MIEDICNATLGSSGPPLKHLTRRVSKSNLNESR